MKKQIFSCLVMIFLIGIASAHASIDYTLIEDKALVELYLGEVSNFEYDLPYDASTIESNSEFQIVNGTLYVLQSDNLEISYITKSVVEKSKKRNFFILNNEFDEGVMLTVELPEGGVLEEDGLMVPNPDAMATDGRTITLRWENLTSEEVVVAYEVVKKEADSFWIIVISLVLVGVIFYQTVSLKKRIKKLKKKKKISRKRQKTKSKKKYTRNLFGEEKKIVEYLLGRKKNESWTKEIVRDLGISKVRLSRRLRNLQQKELVEKIPHGNENRIRLLKKR